VQKAKARARARLEPERLAVPAKGARAD